MESPGTVARAVQGHQEAAAAKVNLFLHVSARDHDGFHPLQSLVVFPDCGDRLTAAAGETLSLVLEGQFARGLEQKDNLVLRAAQALGLRAPGRGATLTLTKNLPVASGIGGGSADAAATLRALNALWRLGLDMPTLCEIAAGLGSDVPVCVAAAPSWMEGRGERLSAVASLPGLAILLVNPGVAVPTAPVFAALQTRSGTDMRLTDVRFGDMADLLRFLDATRNDLEAPACTLQPVIGAVLSALRALPGALFSRMSGSGATCFALFPDSDSCSRAAARLRQENPGWWIQPTSVPEHGIGHEDAGQDIGPTQDGL